jgi:phytoene/squalene synthetase
MMATTIRDRALGRIAVAQHFAQEIADNLNSAMAHFAVTDEDTTGKERRELLETAEYGAHMVASAVGDCLVALNDMDEELIAESEIVDDDDDDEEGDDEEE